MAHKQTTRRARSFRRGMALFLVVVLAVTGYTVYAGRQDRLPEVRVGDVSVGDVVSYMNITADLLPGNTQEEYIAGHLVQNVYVGRGDRVVKGQLLATFDLSPQQKAYEDAKALRERSEAALADATRVAQEMQASSAESALATARQLADLQASIDSILATFEALNQSLQRIEDELDNPAFTLPSTLPSIPSLPSFPSLPAFTTAEPTPSVIPTTVPTEPSGTTASGLSARTAGSVFDPPQVQALAGSTAATTAMDYSSLLQDPSILAALGLSGGTGDKNSQIQSILGSAQSAQLQAIQAEESARKALESAVPAIRASFNGVVYSIDLTPGEKTPSTTAGLSIGLDTAAKAVLTVYDDVHLKAVFHAGRTEAKRLVKGMSVEFVQDGQTYPGSVTSIAAVASGGISTGSSQADSFLNMAGTGSSLSEPTLEIEMQISSHRPGDLLIGFPIDARIRISAADAALMVPSESLKKELGEYYVFVLSPDGVLRKTYLEIGIQSDTHAQVVSGLLEGERVVLNPSGSLADGMAVHVKATAP